MACACNKKEGLVCMLHRDLDAELLSAAVNEATEPVMTLRKALADLALLASDAYNESVTVGSKFIRADENLNLEDWRRLSGIIGALVDKRNEVRDILQSEGAPSAESLAKLIDDGTSPK